MTTTIPTRLLTLAAALSTAPLAIAAEGGNKNPLAFDLLQYVTTIVVFIVALVVLSKLVWPKIARGLDQRQAKIRSEIYAAEEARQSAKAAADNFKKEIEATRAKAQAEVENARAEASRIAADLKVRAEAELTEMRESATRSIEAAKRAAINEIYAEAATLATSVAGKILQREVNVNDQRRLVEETMNEVSARYAKA